MGRVGIEPTSNGLRGGARLYWQFVNQVLAGLANLEISLIRSQFGHSQSGVVTSRLAECRARQSWLSFVRASDRVLPDYQSLTPNAPSFLSEILHLPSSGRSSPHRRLLQLIAL